MEVPAPLLCPDCQQATKLDHRETQWQTDIPPVEPVTAEYRIDVALGTNGSESAPGPGAVFGLATVTDGAVGTGEGDRCGDSSRACASVADARTSNADERCSSSADTEDAEQALDYAESIYDQPDATGRDLAWVWLIRANVYQR